MQKVGTIIAKLRPTGKTFLCVATVGVLTGCTVIPDTFTLRGGTTIFHEEKVKQANFINGEATWRLKK